MKQSRSQTCNFVKCRACLSTAATQARQAATPSRPHSSDVVSHTKCKTHCGLLQTKQTFFTKSHATTVIYRLTVQTWLDGLETQIQFTPPDTTCLVWRTDRLQAILQLLFCFMTLLSIWQMCFNQVKCTQVTSQNLWPQLLLKWKYEMLKSANLSM